MIRYQTIRENPKPHYSIPAPSTAERKINLYEFRVLPKLQDLKSEACYSPRQTGRGTAKSWSAVMQLEESGYRDS